MGKVAAAVLILATAACADEKLASRSYPIVDTHMVSDINEHGVTFTGEILDLGDGVSDHGFIYSEYSIYGPTGVTVERIPLGAAESVGKFSTLANRNMIKDRDYHVRAYGISKANNTIVMGQEFTFKSQGSMPPEIKDFNPKQGTVGDTVLVLGAGFGTISGGTRVIIGTAPAFPFKNTKDSLWFQIPFEVPAVGENSLSVESSLQTTVSDKKFNLLKATITSFAPASAGAGDTIIVHGTNFPISKNHTGLVTVLGYPAAILIRSRTETGIIIQPEITDVKSRIKMNVGMQVLESTAEFTLAQPKIISFTPTKGYKDTEVTITGQYFNPLAGKNKISVGLTAATVVSASKKQVKFRVPGGINPNSYNINITSGPLSTTSTDKFEVVSPVIQGVSPLAAAWGATITITGQNFAPTAAGNTVTFNDITATITSATTTEIKVTVPNALIAKSSSIKVTVPGNDNRFHTFATPFLLSAPEVLSFSPIEGRAQTVVTITGKNFNPIAANQVVKFGDITAQVVSATNTELSVRVPVATDGLWPITVTAADQSGTSVNQFHTISAWRKVASMPIGRYDAVGFELNGFGYVGLGNEGNPTVTTVKKFWKYDPAANTWSEVSPLNSYSFGTSRPFTDLSTFNINGIAYVGVGFYDGSDRGLISKYDPALNKWTQIKTHPDKVMAALGFGIGGKGYIGTGLLSTNQPSQRMWEYDPVGDTWTAKANMPGPARYEATSFVINSRVYITGGQNFTSPFVLKDTWEFDPAADQWTAKAPLPAELSKATAFTLGGKGYVVGGKVTNEARSAEFLRYDPTLDRWEKLDNFPAGRIERALGFVIGNKAYFGTGLGDSPTSTTDFYEFDPSKL